MTALDHRILSTSRVDTARHAQRAREAKYATARALGVDADYVAVLVDRFYARVRDDALLGPIFAARIADWPGHLDRMNGFWRSILHNSGEFSGNPMLKHLVIPGLEQRHFAQWLELFYATLRELETHPEATALVGERARMIADSLLTAIVMRRDGLAAGREAKDLPHV